MLELSLKVFVELAHEVKCLSVHSYYFIFVLLNFNIVVSQYVK